ncbi:hypothetical protein Pflav_007360 [Phytohabitans flavus]|uniref:Uncharacterized protein n=1 Tax=Phytohabitans flavus TaxID=1076124 RepID=A0A6F8XKI2_9ACTN|nr:hypothetical protein Pflav_007360 [Phytohabitans flavus]
MRHPPVDDVRGRHAALDRPQARFHLGHHAGLQPRQQRREVERGDLPDEARRVRPVGVEAGDVGEHDELAGAEGHRESGRGGVGVEVVQDTLGVRRDRGDDRYPASGDEVGHRGEVDVLDVAHLPHVDRQPVHIGRTPHGGEEAGVLTGQPDGERAVLVDEPDKLATHLADEHHPHDVHRLGRGDPQAAAKLALDPEPVEHRRDLRAAAVHDDRLEPGVPQEDHVGRERLLQLGFDHRVAAVLHHDRGTVETGQPRQRLDEGGRFLLGAEQRVCHVE